MGHLIAELRVALRAVVRSSGSSAFAIGLLALGIGGATALFSALDAVLLRPLPFADPDRLVDIAVQRGERHMRVDGEVLEVLRSRSTTIEAISIHGPIQGILRSGEGAVAVVGAHVSANFVELMGVPPLAGRAFRAGEDHAGAPPVMLISAAFWQRRLGGDPAAVGRPVELDGTPYTVIGIMPPSFRTGFDGPEREYWTPYVTEAVRDLERRIGYEVVGRLRPDVNPDEARREASDLATSLGLRDWLDGSRYVGVHRLRSGIVKDSADALLLMLAAVLVVLVMACANLAEALLARSERRVAEFGIRRAIGAGASHLIRLVLAEGMLLAVAGGIAGAILATFLLPILIRAAPSEIPRLNEAVIDIRVLTVALGLTVLTGCMVGLAPALRLSRMSVVDILKRAPQRGRTEGMGFRSSLVVFQVASSVALTCIAVLITRSFLILVPSDPGFVTAARLVFPLRLSGQQLSTPEQRLTKTTELIERLRSSPGVAAVAVSSNIPFSGDDDRQQPIESLGPRHASTESESLRADVRAVSPNVFQLLQVPLRGGRAFTTADGARTPGVAIVNHTLARRLDPTGNVLGRTLRLPGAGALEAYEIVGIVADARSTGMSTAVWNEVYVPFAQSRTSFVHVIIESTLDDRAATSLIRGAVHGVMPELPLRDSQVAHRLADLLDESLAQPRFSAVLMSMFATLAILLAMMGLFGLVTYSVVRRERDLGIRAALGAGPWDLIRTSVEPALKLTAVGLVLGVLAGAYVARLLEAQLYGITSLDLPTFAGAASVVLIIAGVAACLPALRAGRLDPLPLLRRE